jgi:CDP-diacylglycerol--glycerol-3-phosphate 3-phosphatidyltransferase
MAMLNNVRPALSRVLTPMGRALATTGISPNAITVIGTVGVIGGTLGFYPRHSFFWGTVVATVFVLFDLLDGAVARVTGKGSQWGAFLDSTMDRLADAAIFSGILLWYAGRDDLMAALALFCLVSGVMVSYARARAEGLGYKATVGVAERGERLIVSLVAIGLCGLGVPYVLPVGLWLLAVASVITIVQRFVVVRHQMLAAAGAGPEAGEA